VTTAPTPDELAETFFTVAHAMKRIANYRMPGGGLTLARLRALMMLSREGAMRMGELSDCLDVAARTMTSTVDGMVRDGLVERRRDPGDGRVTIIEATDAGRAAFEEGWAEHTRSVAGLFDVLDEAEKSRLLDILHRLETAVDDAEQGALAGTTPRLRS
jgi:DNA-binding MarR family transcriptional regulator